MPTLPTFICWKRFLANSVPPFLGWGGANPNATPPRNKALIRPNSRTIILISGGGNRWHRQGTLGFPWYLGVVSWIYIYILITFTSPSLTTICFFLQVACPDASFWPTFDMRCPTLFHCIEVSNLAENLSATRNVGEVRTAKIMDVHRTAMVFPKSWCFKTFPKLSTKSRDLAVATSSSLQYGRLFPFNTQLAWCLLYFLFPFTWYQS